MKNGWSEDRQAFVQSLRQRQPGRGHPHDAARVLRLADRPADDLHDRSDQPLAVAGRPRLEQPRVPLRRRADAGRDSRRRGHVQHLHLLAGRGPGARGRPDRSTPDPRGAADLRADARVREPPRPVRGGDGPHRRAPRELPAGLHAPRADQRGLRTWTARSARSGGSSPTATRAPTPRRACPPRQRTGSRTLRPSSRAPRWSGGALRT